MMIRIKDLLRDVENFAQDIRAHIEQGYHIESIYYDNENTVYVNFINDSGNVQISTFSAWED